METKKCIKCGEIKSIEEFCWRKDTQTYRNGCKDCKHNYNQEYYKNNSVKILLKDKEYYIKNKDNIS